MKRSALGLGAVAFMGVLAAGLCPGISLAAGPAGVTDASLWLDASQLTGLADGDPVATWTDMSGHGNNAAATGTAATYVTGALNGQPVVRFNADGNASFTFTEDAAIRTVFWVVKNTTPGMHFMLGHSGFYDFHPDERGYAMWDPGYASDAIKNGVTKLMGVGVNGTRTVLPSASYSLVSLVTAGPVRANQLSADRGIGGRSWAGDMAEVLIYDRALSPAEELAVGAYLSTKYGFVTEYLPGNTAALWLDASQLTGLNDGDPVATWTDMSGNGNNAAATGTAATYVTGALNGQPVVRFNADGNASFTFTEDAAIRTVFWVLKNTTPGMHFMLGHSGAYEFHASESGGAIWDAGYASEFIRNGVTKLMGVGVNGTRTVLPSASYSLVSLVTTGPVRANQLSADRGIGGRSWAGDMAEVLIYDHALSPAEERAVGTYLANKYGLATAYTVTGPAGVADAALWLDASQLTGLSNGDTVTAWNDMSGKNNFAAATGTAATYVTGALNGQPVVRFSGDGYSSFNFTEDAAIRTVFWVVKNTNPGLHFMLGHSGVYDFHAGDFAEMWHPTHASDYIKNGTTKLMGTVVNGTATVLPSAAYSLVSVVTTGPVRANTLSLDRGIGGRSWAGDMAEVLIYDGALTPAEESAVGNYLAAKYALATEYASAGIAWGPAQTMSADTDVATSGMLKYAYGFTAAATVNTVPFALGSSVSSLGTDVTFSPGFQAIHPNYGYYTAAPFTSLSAEYQALTSGGVYGAPGNYGVALNNLTPGHTYLVQIWVDDSRGDSGVLGRTETVTSTGGNTATLDYNTTDVLGGVGQYVIGTFTAGGAYQTSQTFTLNGNASTQLNALQLRVMPGMFYWDNNGSEAGFGSASGIWAARATGNGIQGWSADAAGTTTPVDFTSAMTDAVHFGNGAAGLGAGTVTVSGAVSAGDMTFASGSGAITLAGGTITLPESATLVVNNDSDTISSTLAGAGSSLAKSGPGTLVFFGENSYTGGTTVNTGTLLVNNTSGSGTGAGNVTVNDGATLGGTGAIGGNVTFEAGAKALFTSPGSLTVSGSLTLNDTVVHLNLPVGLPFGSYTLATYATVSGAFASVPVIDSGSMTGAGKITAGGGQVVLKVFPIGTMISIF